MRALTGREILHIWEVGQGQHPLDRALTMLQMVFPETARDKLALLSIGQRDSSLMTMREQTFGSRLSSLALCPACRGQVEFMLDISEMHPSSDIGPIGQVQQLTVDGYELHFRLPNSKDLAAIVGCQDVVLARHLLLQRCVVDASREGVIVKAEDLPENVVVVLAAQMDELDPQAEMRLDLTCGACGHQWQVLFDIVSLFWTEIGVCAKRLLGEVHTLALAYGWSEAAILSMSAVRRQFYLEMVT